MKYFLLVLGIFCGLANAAQWTPESGSYVKVINPGVLSSKKSVFIALDEASFSGCSRSDGAILLGDNASFTEIYSLLLAAHVSNKKARLYYNGCNNNFPVVIQAYLP